MQSNKNKKDIHSKILTPLSYLKQMTITWSDDLRAFQKVLHFWYRCCYLPTRPWMHNLAHNIRHRPPKWPLISTPVLHRKTESKRNLEAEMTCGTCILQQARDLVHLFNFECRVVLYIQTFWIKLCSNFRKYLIIYSNFILVRICNIAWILFPLNKTLPCD